jgi:ribonuclease HII
LPVPSLPVIGGDAAAACIAAASVLAKVSRDRLMVAMDADHPGYGFAEHKGYSTLAHSAALNELGPCPEHRYSFINVRRVATGSGSRVRLVTMRAGTARGGTRPWVVAECRPDTPDGNEWGKIEEAADEADRLRSQEESGKRNGEGRLSE